MCSITSYLLRKRKSNQGKEHVQQACANLYKQKNSPSNEVSLIMQNTHGQINTKVTQYSKQNILNFNCELMQAGLVMVGPRPRSTRPILTRCVYMRLKGHGCISLILYAFIKIQRDLPSFTHYYQCELTLDKKIKQEGPPLQDIPLYSTTASIPEFSPSYFSISNLDSLCLLLI